MSENSDKYKRAVAGLSSVLDQVPAAAWSAATPCSEWTGRHLIGHLIGGAEMISQVDTGVAPDYTDPEKKAGDDPAASYRAARDLALAALTEENLAKLVPGPMGDMPVDQMLGMFLTPDVLIHTWDLARTAGLDVTLDPGLVEETYHALQPIDAMLRGGGVFGPKVEPPAGADTQTKLICFVGRQP